MIKVQASRQTVAVESDITWEELAEVSSEAEFLEHFNAERYDKDSYLWYWKHIRLIDEKSNKLQYWFLAASLGWVRLHPYDQEVVDRVRGYIQKQ